MFFFLFSLYVLSSILEFLDFGRKYWTLDSAQRTLDAGSQMLVSGLWRLDPGCWTLAFALWKLGPGRWTVDVKILKFRIVPMEMMEIYR